MKQVLLNAFVMSTVTHSHQGLWRHPRDHSLDYTKLEYWIEFAKLLERGKFDGVFMADSTGTYDVYGESVDGAVRAAVMIPKNDAGMLVSAMAAVTKNLGFGVTYNVSDELPHILARRLSTLDHISNGRIGWNIVTGFLDSAAKARGDTRIMDHDERYDVAEEFMEIVYGLWEKSWEDGAVLRDRETGVYADPAKVHRIQHKGKYFNVDAVHMCEPSPQRTPVLYQAGTSTRGIQFAARHAECIFVSGANPERVGMRVRKLREAAAAAGRDPASLKVLTFMNVITAPTDEEALAKHADYSRYIDREGSLVRMSGFIGIDLSKLELDEPVRGISSNAIQSILENLTIGKPDRQWTVGDIANSLDLDGAQPVLVGSPQRIADELARWVEVADVDGFNLAQTVKPECLTDFIELVVPELQRRGMYKTDYAEGTLREKIFSGDATTPEAHPSAKVRAA